MASPRTNQAQARRGARHARPPRSVCGEREFRERQRVPFSSTLSRTSAQLPGKASELGDIDAMIAILCFVSTAKQGSSFSLPTSRLSLLFLSREDLQLVSSSRATKRSTPSASRLEPGTHAHLGARQRPARGQARTPTSQLGSGRRERHASASRFLCKHTFFRN